MKARFVHLTIFILSLGLVIGVAQNDAAAADKTFINMAGGSSGGTWYTMAVGICKVVAEKMPDINCTPETGGSVKNTRQVGAKKLDFGFSTADTSFHALNGGPEFKEGERFMDIRAIFSGHVSHWHMVTLEESGIKTIEDLKGKRVAIGYVGGSVETVTKEILKEHGLIPDRDFQKHYYRHTGVVTALKDGTIDAGAILTGAPSGALLDLATTHNMRLLPISPEMQDRIIEKYPYYIKGFYEVGVYPKLAERVPTLTVGTYLITDKDTDEKLAYSLAKVISEGTAELAELHPAGKQWSLETVKKGIAIPIHPGAMKLFKEKGISF